MRDYWKLHAVKEFTACVWCDKITSTTKGEEFFVTCSLGYNVPQTNGAMRWAEKVEAYLKNSKGVRYTLSSYEDDEKRREVKATFLVQQ